jgi:hypothetical protein
MGVKELQIVFAVAVGLFGIAAALARIHGGTPWWSFSELLFRREPNTENNPPKFAELLLHALLAPKRCKDALPDLQEMYPQWVREYGSTTARLIFWARIFSVALHEFLGLAYRIAEIIGKLRGAK